MATEWYKDAVFYEVFVRAYADGDGDGIGDLAGLTSKLDYLKELGVDAIWMLPIFPSPLRDDGYDVADYYAIHPDYGAMADLKTLIEAAHERDLRVIIELIPNHTSDQNEWFQASRDPDHPDHETYRDWYVWSATDETYEEARIIFLDYEESNWTLDEKRGEYFWHRFFHHQPDLNYDNVDVQREMMKILEYWIDAGADGFRVDATPYLYQREGTSCENLPETHAYLKRLRSFADGYQPSTMLLSEANQWPEDVLPYFGDGDEFHMNFHFPLMPRIFMALAKADRSPIEHIMARTPDLPAPCQWATFLRCHDELTLEMVTPEEREFMWDTYAPEPRMRLNLGIRRRLAPLLDNDMDRIKVANSILLTFIGSPVIYYGDEIGMGDDIWLEDRDGVRTPMQWSDAPNAGFSTAPEDEVYEKVIDDETYGYQKLNVQDQLDDPDSLLNWMKKVIRVRKEHPAFGRGDLDLLAPDNPAILAYVRSYLQEEIVVVNNLSDAPQDFQLALPQNATSQLVDIFTGETVELDADHTCTLHLDRYGFRWFQLA